MKTIFAPAVFSVLAISAVAGGRMWLGSQSARGDVEGRDLTRSAVPEPLAVVSALELDRVEVHPAPSQPAPPRSEAVNRAPRPAPTEPPAPPEPAPEPTPEPAPVDVAPTPEPVPAAAPVEVAAIPASSGSATMLAPGQTVTVLTSPMSGGSGGRNRGEAEMPAPERRGAVVSGGHCPRHGGGGYGGRGGGGIIGILR